MTTLTIPRLSQSRHEKMACSACYVHSEVYGYGGTDNEYSLLGTEVHSILHSWAAHNHTERNRDTDQIHLARRVSCSSHEAQELIKHFLDNFSLDFSKIVALECRLEGGEDLEGTLDVLLLDSAGHYRIVDYKTQFQVVEAESFQSKLYPLLVMLNYPDAESVVFQLAFVRYGCSRSVTYRRDDIPALMEIVQASRSRQIELHSDPAAHEGEACPGRVCIFCPLLRMRECPIEGRNPYEMSIEERLQWQEYMKRAMKDNAAKLKEHAEKSGPIRAVSTIGVPIVGQFVEKPQKRYKAGPTIARLVEWKEDTGDDIISGLTISHSDLNSKLKAKSRAVLDQELDSNETLEVKQRTEFEIKEV